ncbi:hypothetical protein NADFUDRAFT_82791 [Nadsonia fulvescens var. elongata DSM 6958]|uniref:B box-type domain-containing protein n=1 Tax=Nadsonia fulvescens var. elongata DSM 6958 TaxID=857566 RepID=A0A1E3PK74_9ASCO|nr:hypothetical protein NADFUDRAFT_82791 [Nadsonia fulvescens var. elongata DSM 6958]
MAKRSLGELLSTDGDALMNSDSEDTRSSSNESTEYSSNNSSSVSTDVDADNGETSNGLCVECGDQPSDKLCKQCQEEFCDVCFNYLHRTGRRLQHETMGVKSDTTDSEVEDTSSATASMTDVTTTEDQHKIKEAEKEEKAIKDLEQRAHSMEVDDKEVELLKMFREHTRFIPMRLSGEERKLLRLLEAALNVSDYTDKVDILSYTSKGKRIVAQLKEMCSILAGLVVATNMKLGQELFEDKDFSQNAEWFQDVFEVGRRYKIMNPEKMRDSFGKLMYMIMDSRLPEIKDAMDFDLYKTIKTVYGFLESKDCLELLTDPLVFVATQEIISDGKPRRQVQNEIKNKERAIEVLTRKYSKSTTGNKKVMLEDIRQCLYSIGDYNSYLRSNRLPVETIIKYLHEYFSPEVKEDGPVLSIQYGKGGARLSHNHEKQYHYVNQSLTLWSQIMKDMFKLWTLSDVDLTSTKHRYNLSDTGQGLNRIKACGNLSREMHKIISLAQKRTGSWIGSSVVHLGDHTVPNALFFLDKYLQVPRILTPVYIVIGEIDKVSRDPYVHEWIENQFDGVVELKKLILADFFKHAFDGSGADNFYDAGSCIDGRLTSAWNWANTVSKKPYYKIFLLCGFTGFDGTDGF